MIVSAITDAPNFPWPSPRANSSSLIAADGLQSSIFSTEQYSELALSRFAQLEQNEVVLTAVSQRGQTENHTRRSSSIPPTTVKPYPSYLLLLCYRTRPSSKASRRSRSSWEDVKGVGVSQTEEDSHRVDASDSRVFVRSASIAGASSYPVRIRACRWSLRMQRCS